MANLVETTLYSHEGANKTPLAPATKATQVQIANVEGQASNVETEIVALRTKLNQNAFAKVKVGETTLTATDKQDTLEIEAGEGVTITASGKKVTIKETYIDSCVVSTLDNVPANLRNGGLIILKGA